MRVQPSSSRSGAALMLVLLFTAALAIVLASTVPVLLSDYRTQMRRSMDINAYHLAESGIERALWTLSQSSRQPDLEREGWTLEPQEGDFYYRQVSPAELGIEAFSLPNTNLRVVFENPSGRSRIRVISVCRITNPAIGEPVTRRIVVELEVTTAGLAFSPFIGIVTGHELRFNNYHYFNSYRSSFEHPLHVQGTNDGSNINIATTSSTVELGSVQIDGNLLLPEKHWLNNRHFSVSGETRSDFEFDFPQVSSPDTDGWAPAF